MDKLKRFKYPKLTLILIIYIATIVLFGGFWVNFKNNFFLPSGLFGIFLSGWFYAYGFTAAPATAALLLLAKQQSLFTAGIMGGLGALVGDIFIFFFIRHTLIHELENLKNEKPSLKVRQLKNAILGSFNKFFTTALAGVFIASPLPTELGITILATIKEMSVKKFILLAYILHTLGIFFILFLGQKI